MLGSPDSYCMIAEDGDNTVGFAMGRFETFYDLTAYNLVEIIVAEIEVFIRFEEKWIK